MYNVMLACAMALLRVIKLISKSLLAIFKIQYPYKLNNV
jgi:hypothetical protein